MARMGARPPLKQVLDDTEAMGEEPQNEGQPPDLGISDFDTLFAEAAAKNDYLPLAHAVFRQAAKAVTVCSAAFVGTNPTQMNLARDQAICAGLLVRCVKFMRAVATLSSDRSSGEVTLALNRCILDGATSVLYLIKKDDPRTYDRFLLHSLAPERELHDLILENIRRRGSELPIERRMLNSITRMCRTSGLDIGNVPSKVGPWDGGMRQRLDFIGLQDSYPMFQGLPSAAIHGTWSDLLHHHVRPVDGGFAVRFETSPVDVRVFGAAALILLEAAKAYMSHYFREQPESESFVGALTELQGYVRRVDEAHEEWLQTKRSAKPPDGTSAEEGGVV